MAERSQFKRKDVEKLVMAYDRLVLEVSDPDPENGDAAFFASETVAMALSEMGFYDD